MFPEQRRSTVLEERHEILEKFNDIRVQKERGIPTGDLLGPYRAFFKFRKTAGLTSWRDADFYIMEIGSGARYKAFKGEGVDSNKTQS